jgi:hypothetical protein
MIGTRLGTNNHKTKNEEITMGILSPDEEVVWQQFHQGLSTSAIAKVGRPTWSVAYVSRVLNRARGKIAKALRDQAKSHRLDVESLLDYNGLLIGFDYQANTVVYVVFTLKLGIIVWYKHASYAGLMCHNCPKLVECRETLDTIIKEYDIKLRPDEEVLPMTQQSTAIFNKLAAKEIPRYQRS